MGHPLSMKTYTPQEAAVELGISIPTIYNWIKKGRIGHNPSKSPDGRAAYEITQAHIDEARSPRAKNALKRPVAVFVPQIDPQNPDAAKRFCAAHQEAFGSVPRKWGMLKHGDCSLDELVADVYARIEHFRQQTERMALNQ